jgi:crotonobetainyl-CoA:carnitine CoA-transferase CaiB-like acyl-CoA transferase
VLPLEGVRVLAVEQFGAGPWATLQLADLGADVIKVEDPASSGDIGRYVPPYRSGEDSLFFEALNRGKRSISLDLRAEGAMTAFRDLVRSVDVVFCNLRGDLPERLGLTYAQLRDVNPRIVCCSLSGYGRTGPMAAQGAYDYVIQARAGWMSLTGEPDGPPAKSGLSLVDFAAGYVAALAVLAGLRRAEATGEGCDCDVALLDTAISLLNYVGTWVGTEGFEPRRHPFSQHPSIVPFQIFGAADGHLVVACAKQKFWERLCAAIGRTDLLEDPRFADLDSRNQHREELVAELTQTFGSRAVGEWIDLLEAAGVPCAPVNDVAGALADPQVRAREAVVESEHPRLGTVSHVAGAVRAADAPRPPTPGPARGEHTDEVLAELAGYDRDQIARLREAGALGPR